MSGRIVIVAALAALAACGKKDDKPSAGSAGAPVAGSAVGSAGAPPAGSAEGSAAGSAGSAGSAAFIDVCTWVPLDKVEKALGVKVAKATPPEPTPGILGGCDWTFGSAAQHIAFVTVHPVEEFEDFAQAAGDNKPVDKLGEKALATKNGLFVKVGKPYFLKFQVNDGMQKIDHPKAIALAGVIAPAAK